MCTVTFIARRHGYVLGMNRDEKRSRVAGLPPRVTRLNGRTILAPSEPGGGTWIGANDTGSTLALINWYSVHARVTDNAFSRGEVVKSSLSADSPDAVDETLGGLPLGRVNPFRLVGVFLPTRAVVEWRWNLKHLKRLDHPWRANTWISSGYDEPGAQRARGRAFRRAVRQKSAGTLDWLRRLHRSHGPERGPYSHCMHREDAATVSYTEVAVSSGKTVMRYAGGPPCSATDQGGFKPPSWPGHTRGQFLLLTTHVMEVSALSGASAWVFGTKEFNAGKGERRNLGPETRDQGRKNLSLS